MGRVGGALPWSRSRGPPRVIWARKRRRTGSELAPRTRSATNRGPDVEAPIRPPRRGLRARPASCATSSMPASACGRTRRPNEIEPLRTANVVAPVLDGLHGADHGRCVAQIDRRELLVQPLVSVCERGQQRGAVADEGRLAAARPQGGERPFRRGHDRRGRGGGEVGVRGRDVRRMCCTRLTIRQGAGDASSDRWIVGDRLHRLADRPTDRPSPPGGPARLRAQIRVVHG